MAINLNELTELLNSAQHATEKEKEVRKALTRIENLMGNISREVQSVYELLDGTAPVKKERKPPREGAKKPGRKPKAEPATE